MEWLLLLIAVLPLVINRLIDRAIYRHHPELEPPPPPEPIEVEVVDLPGPI